MARGASRAESERTDRMRARAEDLLAKASEIDTKDAMKAAKAAAKAKEKAEKESKAALSDPVKMADSFAVNVDRQGQVSMEKDGEKLYSLSYGGTYTRNFGPAWFEGVFKELPKSMKESFVRQLTERGMDEKVATKTVDLLAERAKTALFGKVDFVKEIQKPEVQAQIEKEFSELDRMVKYAKESRATAREYSSSPSDDGSYNLSAAAASQGLADHVAYLNRVRDEIGHYEISMQYGEKVPLNKQTRDWMQDLVYGGALDKAYQKHRDLFID